MGLRHVASDPLKASMKALALPQEIMEHKCAIHKTLKKTQLGKSPFYFVEFKLYVEEFLVHVVVQSECEPI